MKRIIHPSQQGNVQKLELAEIKDPVISDISIEGLIGDGLLVLYREIKNLMSKSMYGKLEASDARDLRDHLKLLFELKNREKEFLNTLTDEEIESKAKEVLDNDNK